MTQPIPTRTEIVLLAIRTHMKTNYCMPTIRQLVAITGITSTSVVRRHLQHLVADKSLVEVRPDRGTYGRYQLPEVVEAIQKL